MGEIRLAPDQERVIRRSALTRTLAIAGACGAGVVLFILFLLVYGDPAGNTPAGQVDVTLSWHADGRVVATIDDPAWDRAGQRRYADAVVPTLFPEGTPVDTTFRHDPKNDRYDIRAASREPIAPIRSALHFDGQRLLVALPAVGIHRVDVTVETPDVANQVVSTQPPDWDAPGTVQWSGVPAAGRLRFVLTLHAIGRSWAVGQAIVILVGLGALVTAVAWSWRAGRVRPERQARRVLIVLTVVSCLGWLGSLLVSGHLDEVQVAYGVSGGWLRWLHWGPPLLWVAVGAWSFFSFIASDLRDTGRRRCLPPPPIRPPVSA